MSQEERFANSPHEGTSPNLEGTNSPQVTLEEQPASPPQVGTSTTTGEQPASPPQEALKKRVKLFTEGLVKMTSPVLLALAMNKVDLPSKGNRLVRGSISPFAAITLEGGILLFVWLWLSSSEELLTGNLKKMMDLASKLLVYLCGLLLMALASDILLLISMDKKLWLPIALIPFYFFTILCCWGRMQLDEDKDKDFYGATTCEAEVLETSVDFMASITTLVFLGLGRFALEVGGDPGKAHGGDHLTDLAVASFVICVLGVYFTLYGIMPLMPTKEGENRVRQSIEISNGLIAVAVSGIVIWITWVIMEKPWAILLFCPPLASLFAGIFEYLTCSQGDPQQQQEDDQQTETPGTGGGETKPAPLELTKATFTGFLLVAVPSSSAVSISNYSHAFILLTAAAVVSSLLWRLLTHGTRPSPGVVRATNVASFFAHSCLAAAVVPFAVLAVKGQYVLHCPLQCVNGK